MESKSSLHLIINQEGTKKLDTYFNVTITDNQPIMMEKIIENFTVSANCPVRNVLDRFGDKWSILILMVLGQNGTMRFNEINKTIGDISQKMLTVTLRTLEADGLISRQVFPEIPPRVEYQLTHLGFSLIPHINNLATWANEHIVEIKSSREKFKV